MRMAHQGDILHVEGIKAPVLVCSKDFFNQSSMIVACPLLETGQEGPLHISVQTEQARTALVHCEKLALLDLSLRGWKKADRLPLSQFWEISDAIQGIFDYL
ncbi:MAG: type II toxin-antitoxin system PemK/MazF family toxin [Lachnospiraceae bacterium]|nr:type II toxin-antitoxin system PemK/MazF family toxin [Lachnospiraceae bacterium]